MAEDPKRLLVEMVGRLGRETQMHLDERQHHFRINKLIVVIISVMMMIIAMFNIYYVRILWKDLNGIVDNMDSMHTNMQIVSGKMQHMTNNVKSFEYYMRYMDEINEHTSTMAAVLPKLSSNMHDMTEDIVKMEADMRPMAQGMISIDHRFGQMTLGVATMRHHVKQISRPMGAMNPFMP
jgi:hypothetical protein